MTDENMSREDIKEFVFDVFVEIVEATGAAPALPPVEIARLSNQPEGRVKGCMMELVQEGVLDKFKEDGELLFHLADSVLDGLLAEMEEEGWVPPEDPFGEAEIIDEEEG